MDTQELKNKPENFGDNDWIVEAIKGNVKESQKGADRITGNYFVDNLKNSIDALKLINIEIDISVKYKKK